MARGPRLTPPFAPRPGELRDAAAIPAALLAGEAVSLMLHVPGFLGARWVEANRAALEAAGVDPAEVVAAFRSGLTGTPLLGALGIPETRLEQQAVHLCVACVAAHHVIHRGRSRVGFDLFVSHSELPNGDHGLVLTFAPAPPAGLLRYLRRFLEVRAATTVSAARLGGRPVLRVRRGVVAHWWRETRAFRKRASALWFQAVRAQWREEGREDRLPPDPYAVPRAPLAAWKRRQRRTLRRSASREIAPILEFLGLGGASVARGPGQRPKPRSTPYTAPLARSYLAPGTRCRPSENSKRRNRV